MIETEHYYIDKHSDNTKYIVKILQNVKLKNNFIFIIDGLCLINRSKNTLFAECKNIFKNIEKLKNICKQKDKNFIILISLVGEAPTYRYNLKNFCDSINKIYDIKLKNILIFSGAKHQFDEQVNYSITAIAMNNKLLFDFKNIFAEPKYHFIGLARIARPHRIHATIEIIDRNLLKYGNCSLGSGYYYNINENFDLNFVPEKYKNIFPMFIDGVIANETFDEQYKGNNEKLTHAFINYVQETSFEGDKEYHVWGVPFLTEKTTKPFAWGQVPIFNCIQGNVEYVREFGFDLFDDIIDHSYDNITEPMIRIRKSIDQLEKICSWSIKECVEYKHKNIDRFIKNRQIAENLENLIIQNEIINLQEAFDKYD